MIPLKDDNPNQNTALNCSSSARFLVYHTNPQQHSRGVGVAWYVHIGGFVAGLLFVRLFATQSPLGEGRPRKRGISIR